MIPVVDLARGAAAAADEVRRACEEVGFLMVVGHGVPDDAISDVARVSRDFFDLPEDEKRLLAAPAAAPGVPVYRPLGFERLGSRQADRKESLDYGPTLDGVAWPERPAGLRAAYERYYAELLRLAGTIVRSFAVALGLGEDGLDPYFDDRSSSIRVIDYPAIDAASPRAGAHRDYGCLTIIRSDAGGLQAQTRDGAWVDVEPPPGALIVNIGDLMARWTNDRWVSTLHRVVGSSGASPRRQSLVFFHNPRADALIEPLGDGPARHAPVRAGEYVLARAARAFREPPAHG